MYVEAGASVVNFVEREPEGFHIRHPEGDVRDIGDILNDAASARPGTQAYLDEAVAACLKAGTYAIDMETSSFNPLSGRIIGFSVAVDTETVSARCVNECCPPELQVPKSWYFQFVPEQVTHLSNAEAMEAYPDECVSMRDSFEAFEEVFLDKTKWAVFHNAKFDLKFIFRAGLTYLNQIIDTCIAGWLLNENSLTQKLKDLVERHLDHQMVKFKELGGLFSPDIDVYGADDACQTLRLWRVFEPRLKRQGLLKVFLDLECRVVRVLVDMELRGCTIDIEHLEGMRSRVQDQIQEVELECFELLGRRFMITSPTVVGKILFDELKWRKRGKIEQTKTGAWQTDKDVLDRYSHDHPLAAGILKSRELRKLESTYLDSLIEAALRLDGRVRSSFNQVPHPRDNSGGTVSGRLSSSADSELGGCNLQNIPSRSRLGKLIRHAFIAEPGKVLVVYDYSQIELRLMAHYCKDKTLLAAYQTWRCGACNKHGKTRVVLHECPKCGAPEYLMVKGVKEKQKMYPDGTPVEGAFCLGLDIHQITATACGVDRNLGKVINFALLYGLGVNGLARHLKIKKRAAGRIHRAYFEQYSGIGKHNLWVRQIVMRQGWIGTILKRRRRFPHKKGKLLELWEREWRQAANNIIQGSAADLMKLGARNVHERLDREDRLHETGLILQVHDEMTVETPEEDGEYMEVLVRDEMEGAFGTFLSVPIIAEGSRGPSWGGCK